MPPPTFFALALAFGEEGSLRCRGRNAFDCIARKRQAQPAQCPEGRDGAQPRKWGYEKAKGRSGLRPFGLLLATTRDQRE